MGRNKAKKSRRSNANESEQQHSQFTNTAKESRTDDGDTIHLDSDCEHDWITNHIWAEAKRKKTRDNPAIQYTSLQQCLLGVERIIAITKKDDFEYMPMTVLESQIIVLKKYHESSYKASVSSGPADAEELVKRNDIIERFEARYEQVTCDLLGRINTLKAEDNTVHNSTANTMENSVHREIRVRDVDIVKFGGKSTEWPQFKSAFEECFHKRTDIQGAIKFYHLMAHLIPKSEAYETVDVFDRTDANYTVAWQTLCDTYDNERKIVNNIVLSFLDMPSISERPTRVELIALVIKTIHLKQSLPKYGIAVDSWDPILVPLLVRKLDGESIRLWSLERNQRQIAKLQPLLVFIKKRADSLDADFVATFDNSCHAYASSRQQQSQSSFVSKRAHFRGADNAPTVSNVQNREPIDEKRRRFQCYHCHGPHSLYDCESFGRMSEELQDERLRNIGLCAKCFGKKHNVQQCPRSNCKCGKPHNQVLCNKRTRNTPAVLSISQQPSVKDIEASLIATLQVIVFDEHGNKVEVKALSDGGSHMNMISERLVQRLKLKRLKLAIPSEGAGKNPISSNSIVDFKVAPAKNGTNPGEWIRAGVLNNISGRLPTNTFDIAEWQHIQGLPLADTVAISDN